MDGEGTIVLFQGMLSWREQACGTVLLIQEGIQFYFQLSLSTRRLNWAKMLCAKLWTLHKEFPRKGIVRVKLWPV
jgi:hypothetical protein